MNPPDFDHDAWQDLRDAIRSDDHARVTSLLSKKTELLQLNTTLGSCLHFAASKGRLAIVQQLITLGVNINLEADVGGSPLDQAASNGHLEVVKFLVKQGATLAVRRPDRNPLFSAIYGGHVDVAKFLLEAGLDPHTSYRGASGRLKNALSFAQDSGKTEICALLLNAGCRLPIEGVDKPVWEHEEYQQEEEST